MKISNSKKELARIISENGGWCEWAEFSVSSCNGTIVFSKSKPKYTSKYGWTAVGGFIGSRIELCSYLKNWHQTILSREEYSHIYPAPNAKTEFCESVIRSIPEPTAKPTIEQLAADYRNAKDYADRKQQEADDAKADADEALRKLELAGEEIGIVVTPIAAKKQSELAREVKVGDEVECVESNVYREKYRGMIGTILEVDDSSTPYLVDFGGGRRIWCHEVKFIRRP